MWTNSAIRTNILLTGCSGCRDTESAAATRVSESLCNQRLPLNAGARSFYLGHRDRRSQARQEGLHPVYSSRDQLWKVKDHGYVEAKR